MTKAWTAFTDWIGTLSDLSGTLSLMGWDRETLMPPGGADGRARHMGTLSTLHHRELVRPDMAGVLDEVANDDGLDAAQRRQVELAMRHRSKAERLPESLVRDLSEATSRSVNVWIETRNTGDYPAYAQALAEVVRLKRAAAALLSDGGEPYDALLDDFEPGAHAASLEPIFDELVAAIPPLVDDAASRAPAPLPGRTWPAEAQLALGHDLAEMIGYDLGRGFIGRSAHPVTMTIGRGDVRFTTRIDTGNPLINIGTVMHEAGHALYEQGFPADAWRSPLQDAPSMGAHESQSRFWENHIGRRPQFWARIEPMLRARFPEAMADLDVGRFADAAVDVRPSLIRTEADEVTYNLHIALRFTLELGLVRGDLEVEALPSEWRRLTTELLGLQPEHDGQGVMQDIHWAEGLFGYFPTYTLGNLYAAQLAEAADRDLGGLDAAIAAGRFADILSFMRTRVHVHANLRPTDELMRDATGAPLGTRPLIDHLTRVVAGE
ncbi:MAG: carboxypeptidase M32 [Actinobacteria bacterium]|nr:carboxypeptidase M32 [Actinomycetota bacterium]